jgi:hypothetical protein
MLAAISVAWMFDPLVAGACQTCFGVSIDTPTTRGIAVAMLLLVGVTGVVGCAICAFFLHVRRRIRMLEPGGLVVTEEGEIGQRIKSKE